MFDATFVLSTGRCGTQWLAQHLHAQYGDQICVRHEPLHDAYRPREMLGYSTPEHLGPEKAAPILAHADFIERELQLRPYIECGHPCWSSIPYLSARFKGHVRVIHLARHPVPTAFSWMTHGAYQPPLLPHLREKVLLSPFDPGVHFTSYGARWPALTSYEKCLYYWAEVNKLGLEMERSSDIPWLRMTFEELFGGEDLERLLAFLDLPQTPAILTARIQAVDQFRYLSGSHPERMSFERHPDIAGVAAELGFDLAADIKSLIHRQYFA